MHDLRVERALGHGWAYAWCPCGWATDLEYNPRSDTENDFRRAFHGHLREGAAATSPAAAPGGQQEPEPQPTVEGYCAGGGGDE